VTKKQLSTHEFFIKLIEEAVNEFSKLPGVGKRTALRFVLHLMKQNSSEVNQFGNAFIKLRAELRYCEKCHNVSDKPCVKYVLILTAIIVSMCCGRYPRCYGD